MFNVKLSKAGYVFTLLMFISFAVIFLLVAAVVEAGADEPVDIPDENLEEAIREALSKETGEEITLKDMEKMEKIKSDGSNISDISGELVPIAVEFPWRRITLFLTRFLPYPYVRRFAL